MEIDIQDIRERLADGFQGLADKDTLFRDEHAEMIGHLVAETDPDWSVTAAVAGAIITDKTDGLWAKTARKVRGYDIATDGGHLDPLADHKLLEGLLTGLICRAERLGDMRATVRLKDNLYRTRARNHSMDENRRKIHETDVDNRELRANTFNKAKMVLQSLGGLALSSPFSKNRYFKFVSLLAISAGTKSSEIGERKFRKKVDQLVAKNDD